jgi:hypothetical protein
MLKFHGHTFCDSTHCACHAVGDAKAAVVVDPTNTGKLRAKFRMAMRQRWNQLRELTKQMLSKQDLLALKSGGLLQVTAPAITGAGSKIDVFQRWFDLALSNAVLQKDGSFMRPYLSEAYAAGVRHAQGLAKTNVVHPLSGHREAALQSLARVELEGIIEAVSQQSVRAVSEGLLSNAKPMEITRSVLNIIEKVGVNRSNAMIELLVVRAHANASLDIYEAAGVKAVGLLPESIAMARVTDAKKAQSAPTSKAKGKDARRLGPGSRSRAGVPSRSTISRIRTAELRVAQALGENVNVRTAGDFEVCPTCEAISENGPYSINTARSLIPAHPHCCCTFVPADDARFATDAAIPFSVIEQKVRALPTTGGNEKDIANPLKLAPQALQDDLKARHEGVHGWTAFAAKHGKTDRVSLSSLVTIQPTVDRQRVLACVAWDLNSTPEDQLPVVLYYDGYSILWDGNHRVVAAYFRGEKTTMVRSFKLDDFVHV